MRKITGVLFVLLLLTSSFSVFGFEEDHRTYLSFGGVSKHLDRRTDGNEWNQRNPGIGLQFVSPGTLWGDEVEYCGTLGRIKNSEFGESFFAGGCVRRVLAKGSFGSLSAGFFGGAMNYPSKYQLEQSEGKFFFVVLPVASACVTKWLCFDGTYIPAVEKGGKEEKEKGKGSRTFVLTGRVLIKEW